MNYKRKKVLDVNTFNEMLLQVSCKSKVRYYEETERYELHKKGIPYQDLYKLDIDKCYIKLTFMLYNFDKCAFNSVATYIFNCAGRSKDDLYQKAKIIDDNSLTGKEAYANFQRLCDKAVPDLSHEEWAKEYFVKDDNGKMIIKGPDAMLFYNPKFSGKVTHHCYGYDMNSSYGYALKQPIPNTTIPKIGWDYVKKNHIGFVIDTNKRGQQYLLPVLKEGEYCSIQFPIIESPFKDTVDKIYNLKKQYKKKRDKYKAGSEDWNKWNDKYDRKKANINFAVGYIKLHNPFIQATVVYRTYDYMKKQLIRNGGHIMYCNTDSLYADMPLDIPIGNDVGEFKLEHENEDFKLKGCQYQWGDGVPTYRGVPKPLFKEFEKEHGRAYNLLTDVMPRGEEYNCYECIQQDGIYRIIKRGTNNGNN